MENKKIAAEIAIRTILLVAIVFGWLAYRDGKRAEKETEEISVRREPDIPEVKVPEKPPQEEGKKFGCPQDAKLCPDGSSVSRQAPVCAFAECPMPKGRIESKGEWEKYINEVADFSIEYPKEWGPVDAEVYRDAISGSGEEFYVLFANSGLNISGVSSDFVPWESALPTYTGGDPLAFCESIEKRVVTVDGCRKISPDRAEIVWGEYYDGMIAGLYLQRDVFVRNSGNKYSGITLSYEFDVPEAELSEKSDKEVRSFIKDEIGKIDSGLNKKLDKVFSSLTLSGK